MTGVQTCALPICDKNLLHHPEIKNLFPCGEGAGYAGGIVSAAMDGRRVAERMVNFIFS